MHGGIKVYHGNPAGARAYIEADHCRADDYYLAEGSGIAERYAASPGTGAAGVLRCADLDAPTYERWVHGYDVETGTPKGQISNHDSAVRFVEIVVNGPKTWSIAASLHPEISAAYGAAQERAATEIIGWLAEHSTTRAGSRGRQVQVPVESGLEAAVIRHYTSRAGDPHRHLHLQVNAKVFAIGQWRALHSVGTFDNIEALNGIGHAAVMCDPEFRAALAAHGYSLDENGEVRELAPYVGRFSQRSAQITRNVDRYEAAWRAEHPDQEPGPRLRRIWDRRAWADARPDKVVPKDGAELVDRWHEELRDLGFRAPSRSPADSCDTAAPIGLIRRDIAVDLILTRLGSDRSAWNRADVRGEAEKVIASVGVIAERDVRGELAEDLTARAVAACRSILRRTDVPEHVRSLTSDRVLGVEAKLNDCLAGRADLPVALERRVRGVEELDDAQQQVVRAFAGAAGLLVIEGAAGTGKTTTLAAAREALEARDRRLVVVTPTLKAAQAAQRQVGTDAFSAAWLIHQHGYRWDEDGHWSRVETARAEVSTSARLLPGDVLLIDEAGMLDQDTAHALFAIADRNGATLALLGDRHQLPAVGRGGVLDLAARWVRPQAHLELESMHRFADPAYADLSLLMRTGERPGEVFDSLLERGEIVLHASEVERTATLAAIGAAGDQLVIADTREQVGSLNAAIRDKRTGSGERSGEPVTNRGERIGLCDRIATRRNDRDLGVANRDTWVVAGIGDDGSLVVSGRAGQRELPAAYVNEHVELAFATTVYGAQGDTVDSAHLVIGDGTGAAAAYVGMTRGRHTNAAHLVAYSIDDARNHWVDVFSRDRADLGPAHAAEMAAEDIARYGPQAPRRSTGLQAAMLQTGVRRPREPVPGPSTPARPGIGR
jgi:exodeoxyribonuclease V alpha subunit